MKRSFAPTDTPIPEPVHHVPQSPRLTFWRNAFLAAAALMTVTASLVVGIFMAYVGSLPPIEELENYDPPEISRVSDRTGAVQIGEFKNENRMVVSIDEIPPDLQHSFVAIEDSRFYTHYGVDVIGILRAIKKNIVERSFAEGASTLTMQLTRNILPESVGSEKKLARKIKEAVLALKIESRYSKAQILEFYLNHIDFSHNAYGIKAAAATYFSKDLNELTLAECALLAGIPKATTRYNPRSNPQRSMARRDVVLRAMLDQGYITQEDYELAIAEPLRVRPGRAEASKFPYFLDGLKRDLNGAYGLSDDHLKEGGLHITSTIDPAIQEACVDSLEQGILEVERLIHGGGRKTMTHYKETEGWNGVLHRDDRFFMKITAVRDDAIDVVLDDYTGTVALPDPLPYHEPANVLQVDAWINVRVLDVNQGAHTITGELVDQRPVQGSMVVLDARTAEVLALVGGTNFYDPQLGWYNRTMQGGRQVGSCFKPFFFAAGFAQGRTPADMIVDEPVLYGRDYRPKNYENEYFGPTTLIEALEHSRNIVTIRLFESLGIGNTLRQVRKFDHAFGDKAWRVPPEINACLGTADCTPIEMAAAYQVFSNQGVGVRPQFFRSIIDPDGRIEVPLRHEEQVVLDPIAAYQTLYLLQDVVKRGSGYRTIGSKFKDPKYPPIGGKTGTTNDCRDAWFCGVTPELVIVVQVGFDTPHSMGPGMTGSTAAGPIWANAFEAIFKTRDKWIMQFDAPPGIEYADISAATGNRASDYTRANNITIYEDVPFRAGTAPTELDNGVPRPPIIRPVSDSYAFMAQRVDKIGIAKNPDGKPRWFLNRNMNLESEIEVPNIDTNFFDAYVPPERVSDSPAVPLI